MQCLAYTKPLTIPTIQWFTALCSVLLLDREVDPTDRPKTASLDSYRWFQFARLPFALDVALPTFHWVISNVFSLGKACTSLPRRRYSRTFEDHLEHLEETLDLLNKVGFRLNQLDSQWNRD